MKTTTATLVLASAGMAYCNTEIVKLSGFSALELPVNPSPTWPVLSTIQQRNSRTFEIQPLAWDEDSKNSNTPLPHDFWVVLEINEWRENTSLHAFTLRLSWAASIAVAFEINIFRPSAPQMNSNSSEGPTFSWHRYARLRASNTGIRPPRDPVIPNATGITQFNLILEPLLWGAVPRSVVPTLLFLLAVIGVSSWMVPRVLLCLSQVVEDVRLEGDAKRQ